MLEDIEKGAWINVDGRHCRYRRKQQWIDYEALNNSRNAANTRRGFLRCMAIPSQ